MKIATFNINNVNKRLANLLQWLKRSRPDIVCLQELKCEERDFPEAALLKAGYFAVWEGQRSWNGVAILSRRSQPIVTRRRLPGDPADREARYIEAAVDGLLIACLYLPNGNPQPGPKFDYKMKWFRDWFVMRLNCRSKAIRPSWLATITSRRAILISTRRSHGPSMRWFSPGRAKRSPHSSRTDEQTLSAMFSVTNVSIPSERTGEIAMRRIMVSG